MYYTIMYYILSSTPLKRMSLYVYLHVLSGDGNLRHFQVPTKRYACNLHHFEMKRKNIFCVTLNPNEIVIDHSLTVYQSSF